MKEQILDTIEAYDTVIIHRHIRPDPDAIGSQGGLAEILRTSYPEKSIYVVGSEEPSLSFLNRMEDIPDHTYDGSLVIVCDTANSPRISDERYRKGDKLVKIDHHPNEDPYGDLIWVDTSASSVSEMIYELCEYGKDRGLVLTDRAAFLLYAGIVGDTGRFLFDNTTEKTFRVAAGLRKYDFSIADLYTELDKMKLNVIRLDGYVLQSFEMYSSGAAQMKLDAGILKKFRVTANEGSLLVNAFSRTEGIKAWVFFIEEQDEIRVRLRSKGPVINGLAKKYGGGGHPMASGASINSWEEAEKLMKELDEMCRNYTEE
ncbi:MAG TPA: bifunctional oligoribonuclease/PAP phosphatase NrnA [Bacillales bacterium]|nr:bifunctional oligoribonuclease/PAP phosphatase NrnA [Bacillales bacterium]